MEQLVLAHGCLNMKKFSSAHGMDQMSNTSNQFQFWTDSVIRVVKQIELLSFRNVIGSICPRMQAFNLSWQFFGTEWG